MKEITLAQALKLKNRLVSRMTKIQTDIQFHNSTEAGNQEVDVKLLLEQRATFKRHLLALKLKISQANGPIQEAIFHIGECKDDVTFFQTINTRHGKQTIAYGANAGTHIDYQATLRKADVDAMIKKTEGEIDICQVAIDTHNYTKKISVPDELMELCS